MDAAMNVQTTRRLALCVCTLLFIGHLPAAMAQDAGSVVFVKGDVSAERQPPETLAKGDAIRISDSVVTGDASRAQLQMLDGAKIAMRPNSRLLIEDFSYTPPATAGAAVTSSSDKSVIGLVKGGFRTITGAIGKENEADYEVRTAVGVLGIRGTDYTAVFCNGDCDWVPGGATGASIPDGLYLGVSDGVISFRTTTTTIELKAGEYAFIPLDNPVPQRMDSPPAVLLDENDLRFDPSAKTRPDDGSSDDGSSDDGKLAGGNSTGFNATLGTRRAPESSSAQSSSSDSSQDSNADDNNSDTAEIPVIGIGPDGTPVDLTPGTQPDPQGPRTISFSTGPLGTDPTGAPNSVWTATMDNGPGEFQLDAGHNLTAFAGPYPVLGQIPPIANFDINSAANIDTGFDSMTVMRWGRWSGGSASIMLSDGSTVTQDLGSQSIHWISGPEGAPPAMPVTGIATYSLIGSTSPTDDRGNVGVLGSASFVADFTNMSVDSSLQININGSNWLASGIGNIGTAAGLPAHMFQGLYGSVVVDGIGGGTGLFSGFFSDPGSMPNPLFPAGAGLTFSLLDAQGAASVSGAVVFGTP
jgi:FecR-like protein